MLLIRRVVGVAEGIDIRSDESVISCSINRQVDRRRRIFWLLKRL